MKAKKNIQLEKNLTKDMLWNQSELNVFLSWQFWKLAPTTFRYTLKTLSGPLQKNPTTVQ